MEQKETKLKAFTLSFDDGVSQDRRLVELLNRYGLRCTFNLNTGIQTEKSNFIIEGKKIFRMEQEGLVQMYAGHEIASHGLTHAALPELSEEELHREIKADIDNIQSLYGEKPIGFAYAYGAYNEAAIKELQQQNIRYARTVEASHSFALPEDWLRLSPTCHYRDERLMELAERFVSLPAKEPALFYVWGHSYELDVHQEWDKLEEFFAFISGREDIFYGTNRQCFERLA